MLPRSSLLTKSDNLICSYAGRIPNLRCPTKGRLLRRAEAHQLSGELRPKRRQHRVEPQGLDRARPSLRRAALDQRADLRPMLHRTGNGSVESVEGLQPRSPATVIAAVRVDVDHPAARRAARGDVPARWRRLLLHEPQPERTREHRRAYGCCSRGPGMARITSPDPCTPTGAR